MNLKMIGVAALAAAAMTTFGAGTASATTIEVGGVKQTGALTITMSLEAGTSFVFSRTDGGSPTTCTAVHLHGKTSVFTGTRVTGPLSTLDFTCNHVVTTHNPGTFYIEHITGTTNGDLFSEDAEWTIATTLGFTVTCKTGAGTKLGTVTGVAAGSATVDVNAVLNCGFLLPSASAKGTFTITNPNGAGIVS